jgi:hypothetical protein
MGVVIPFEHKPMAEEDLEALLEETERQVELSSCLEDDEEVLDTETYYNEVVSKHRMHVGV